MVPRGATGWLVPFLVLAAGLLVGGLLIVMDGAPGRTAATDALPAKVVATTPCGPQDARDTVQVVVDGRSQRLALDGCGYPVGTELQVELLPEGPTARLTGTGQAASGPAEKISLLLLVLAGFAGALFTMMIPRRQS